MTNIKNHKPSDGFERDSDTLDETVLRPEDARAKLETLGFTKDMWPTIMADEKGSHYTRSLIEIARQNAPADINDIYHEKFPEKQQFTDSDREATVIAEASSLAVGRAMSADALRSNGVVIHGAERASQHN